MEKRSFFLGTLVGGLMLVLFYPMAIEAQDYFGKFPPTTAFNEVEIANDAVPFPNAQTNLEAISYSDKFFIVSDGSIIINVTQYPPSLDVRVIY